MIRSSKHTTKFCNLRKQNLLNEFIEEYKIAVQFYIDYLFPRIDEAFNSPKFISTKNVFPLETNLSQRALKCASTQACGMIKAQTEKPRKVFYVINKLIEEGKPYENLQKWLNDYKFSKPTVPNNFNCELNSICCDLKTNVNFSFLQLKSLGKRFGKIKIPLKEHRQSKKWKKQGEVLNSFLVGKNFVCIRYDIEKPEVKKEGITVGADQGLITCLTLSDGQTTKPDKDGWDFRKIAEKMSRKKKESKNFRKAQNHRKNYVNWSINQLNLSNIKKIKLEKVKDIRKDKKTSRLMSHWTYTLIKDKLVRLGEEQKVSVIEQSCVYRSQRCNKCGIVRKENRNGKIYCCNNCGYVGDSDLNASLNHEVELPSVDHLRGKGRNVEGFYWLESGIYDLCHKELTVPSTIKL